MKFTPTPKEDAEQALVSLCEELVKLYYRVQLGMGQ